MSKAFPLSDSARLGASACALIQASVDRSIVTYFNSLGLPNGWRQWFVAHALEAFHREALARGISPGFDPSNTTVLLEIFADLNFKKQPVAKRSNGKRATSPT